MSTRSLSFVAPLTLLAAALFSTHSARAQSSCESASDCPMGYDCQVTAVTACTDAACPAGEECPPPPPCETEEYRDCVAVPDACATDADCSPGMVCYQHTYEICSGESAAPCVQGEECPAPPPPECEPTTQTSCVPQYMLPCETATDCGAGFECKPVEECACSGGGSSGGATPPSDGAGGAPDEPAPEPLPPEDSCTCTPTGTNYCAFVEQACAADGECPSDWTCGDNPESVVCSGPDGSGEGAECGSTEPDKVCLPPYASTVIAVSRDGEPVYASDDDAGNQAGLGEGAPAPVPAAAGGEEAGSDEGGGCSVASGPSSSSAAWLSLLGLAALLRRRRQ